MTRNSEFSHANSEGQVAMVDVAGKPVVRRTATARGSITLKPDTVRLIRDNLLHKGDVITLARVAGIQAAKRTSELIPLCHNLPLDHADVTSEIHADRLNVESRVVSSTRTGVEMEALVAVTAALLTVFDMCKAVDDSMVIGDVRVVEKKKEDPGVSET